MGQLGTKWFSYSRQEGKIEGRKEGGRRKEGINTWNTDLLTEVLN